MRARVLPCPGPRLALARQLHWIPGTMSVMSTTTIRTLACALPVTLG